MINKKENTLSLLGNLLFVFFFFISILSFSNRSEKLNHALKKDVGKTITVHFQKSVSKPIDEPSRLHGGVLQHQFKYDSNKQFISCNYNLLLITRHKQIQKLQLKIKPSFISTLGFYFHGNASENPVLKA